MQYEKTYIKFLNVEFYVMLFPGKFRFVLCETQWYDQLGQLIEMELGLLISNQCEGM